MCDIADEAAELELQMIELALAITVKRKWIRASSAALNAKMIMSALSVRLSTVEQMKISSLNLVIRPTSCIGIRWVIQPSAHYLYGG